jgi:ABC-type anion transport system duplicated permease subunit
MNFWRVDVPFAMPQLIWNMMMSMSGSWFFVVASEAISVGNTTITLPGVGSYIALAIEQKNLAAVGYAIATMLIVILIYDRIAFVSSKNSACCRRNPGCSTSCADPAWSTDSPSRSLRCCGVCLLLAGPTASSR